MRNKINIQRRQVKITSGNGLLNFIKDKFKKTGKMIIQTPQSFINNPSRLNEKIRTILNQYGDISIKNIMVCRTPVQKLVQYALGVVSLGQFQERIKNADYDDIFHLYMVITLENNNKYVLEKNAIIELDEVSSTFKRENSECINILVNRDNITLKDLLTKTESFMGDRFYTYSAKNNNCQEFIVSILKSNQLGTQKDYNFIKQDTKQLFKDDSYLRKLSNSVTGLGASVSTILIGQGIDKNKGHKIYYNNIMNDKVKPTNKWIDFVKSQVKEGLSYRDAMRSADVKKAYREKYGEVKTRVKKGMGIEISKETPLLEVPVSMSNANGVMSAEAEDEQLGATAVPDEVFVEKPKKQRKPRAKKVKE